MIVITHQRIRIALRTILLLCILYYVASHVIIWIMMTTSKISIQTAKHDANDLLLYYSLIHYYYHSNDNTTAHHINQSTMKHFDHDLFVHSNRTTSIVASSSSTSIIKQQQQQQRGDIVPSGIRSSSSTSINPPQRRISRKVLFIHIGKTGGETLKHIIKIGCDVKKNIRQRLKCFENLPNHTSSSFFSNSIIGYYHCNQLMSSTKVTTVLIPFPYDRNNRSNTIHPNNNLVSSFIKQYNITTFLYTIRHPVDRIQSWYYYINPQSCCCFSNMTGRPDSTTTLNTSQKRNKRKTSPTCRAQVSSNKKRP
jgi:hypothetical protein